MADYWHDFVYVNFGWLRCCKCQLEPDMEWAWQGLGPGEASVEVFIIRVVERLKADGWVMHGDSPCCPACAAQLRIRKP